jgi:hypothetical protein
MALNFASVGFGAAILAGVVLLGIGHPGPKGGAPAPVARPVASNAPSTFALRSVSVDLPASDAAFPGPANAVAITANCLSCHSAGMVMTQPLLPDAAWPGVVEKMIHAYRAPVAAGDVSAIVDYLQATKGVKSP